MEPFRKWDHGVFVPMMLIEPDASIPLVSLSVLESENAETHIAIEKALRPLRKMGVLILGSGYYFHNFSLFFKLSNLFNFNRNA